MTAQEIVEKLNMLPHPEGGYYVETYRSDKQIGEHEIVSVIFFLLEPGQVSYWHKINQDELWFFHQGNPLEVHCISEDGMCSVVELGPLGLDNYRPQFLVEANTIFGSKMKGQDGYSLVSCVVAPGFKFEDFKLYSREELIHRFPHLALNIDRLG